MKGYSFVVGSNGQGAVRELQRLYFQNSLQISVD